MKVLYHGPLWEGSTSLQRAASLARQPGVQLVPLDSGAGVGGASSLWARVRWKLRWPIDTRGENDGLIAAVERERPDVVIVDNSRVMRRHTLRALRAIRPLVLAYYTGDDIMGRHNLSHPLRRSLPEWDLFFTTKTFNVPELRAAGVARPILIGKAYDEALHHPMAPAEVGEDYERFELVFVGTYEAERCASINALAEEGLSIAVYGSTKGHWRRSYLRPEVDLRPSVFDLEYTRAMHHGRIALNFLRKLNRDRITQRTVEIAAMGRPMLAEKTEEHDQHFIDGEEYVGFTTDAMLVAKAREMLADEPGRRAIGAAARRRCVASGYSTDARSLQLVEEFNRRLAGGAR